MLLEEVIQAVRENASALLPRIGFEERRVSGSVQVALPFHLFVVGLFIDEGCCIALFINAKVLKPEVVVGEIEVRLVALRLVWISSLILKLHAVVEKEVCDPAP